MMGYRNIGALATYILPDPTMVWEVPSEWSLEEAASVPVVYSTTLVALVSVIIDEFTLLYRFHSFLFQMARIKKGDSILIHSGTGGIGQAAINLALYYGCTIFTTVGTQEKREFLKKNFPQIPESHIGNSRDNSFEHMIRKETGGRGVDIVLNSLAEEKLLSSVRCLAADGTFLEIGKFDLANNSPLNMSYFKEGQQFFGIMLDHCLNMDQYKKHYIHKLIQESLDKNMIKPLITTVFEHEEIEPAFRYMATGKHMGKVVVKIRDEHETKTEDTQTCLLITYCRPENSTIIIGGLGGFGLELADWLVVRGARKLILTSRKGVTTGYQSLRIK